MTASSIELTVNGVTRQVTAADDELLLAVLRRLGCTSIREGCGVGACGACTALVDGKSTSACLTLAVRADGAEVITAEGLPDGDPVVRSFIEAGALQCGYCIPGFVLMATELLAENPQPAPEEVTEHLSGNICRCGAYAEIRAAVTEAARRKAAAGDGSGTGAGPAARRQGRSQRGQAPAAR